MHRCVWLTDLRGINRAVFSGAAIIIFLNERVIWSCVKEEKTPVCYQSGVKSSRVVAKQTERHAASMCVRTCEVCVVWGVDEIVGEGKGHVFTLVQLLRWDDAVLFSVQVPGEAFHRDLTCTNTTQKLFSSLLKTFFFSVLAETCTLKTSMKIFKPMMNLSDDMCWLCSRSRR